MSGIYKIINKINGKYYVGSSVNIPVRWKKHKQHLNKQNHRNDYLQRAWNKYGNENFDFILVELIETSSLLLPTEQKYLDIAKTERDKCYNNSFIAGRIEMNDSVKKKISELALERYKDRKNIPFLGRHHSKETIEFLKKHCSNFGNKNGMFGKTHSKESIEKIFKNRNMSGKNNPKYDPTIFNFYNEKLEETFSGTKFEMSIKYGINPNCVYNLIKKRCNSTFGWKLI